MVKHMLRTNSLLTLHKKSIFFFLSGVPVCFSPAWGQFYQKKKEKKRNKTKKNKWRLFFAQCTLLGPSSTALNLHSNWGIFTVAMCEVILHDTQYERKPCVCALCSITVWPALVSPSPSWNWKLQPVGAYSTRLPRVQRLHYRSWKFRS